MFTITCKGYNHLDVKQPEYREYNNSMIFRVISIFIARHGRHGRAAGICVGQ